MRAEQAFVGALGADMSTVLTAASAAGLKAEGVRFAVRYLGGMTAAELLGILSAGLALIPVTYADQFDGPSSVAELHALGIPAGCTVFLDVEGIQLGMAPAVLIAKINAWAAALEAGGWQPGLYCGAGSLLTSAELFSLGVVRYWAGMSRIADRNGQLAEPQCGWSMRQLYDTQSIAGIEVDVDVIGKDWLGRLPTWVTA
jgi:hypothetical protein